MLAEVAVAGRTLRRDDRERKWQEWKGQFLLKIEQTFLHQSAQGALFLQFSLTDFTTAIYFTNNKSQSVEGMIVDKSVYNYRQTRFQNASRSSREIAHHLLVTSPNTGRSLRHHLSVLPFFDDVKVMMTTHNSMRLNLYLHPSLQMPYPGLHLSLKFRQRDKIVFFTSKHISNLNKNI